LLDEVGGRVDWLVLPDPKYRPAGGGQQRVGLSVSTAIAGYLSSPILSVSAGGRVMNRTSVPEASIHEHRDSLTREEDVSGAPYSSNRPSIDKVSKTSSVDRASDRHLGGGVSSLVAAHAGTRSRRRGPGLAVPHSSDIRRRAGKYRCGKENSMTIVTRPATMIDLFAGCGGMTQGFVQQGFTPIQAIECDLHAAATYAANFGGDHIRWGDIADWPTDEISRVDVVIGGPPCQGFSNLGSKDVNDPRNKLWREYLRVVSTAHPKVFVLENVQRFSRSSEFQVLIDQADHGSIAGYELSFGVLLAADYGVAQRRPRTIVIGSRIGKIPLPPPTHAACATDDLRPWETVGSRIAGLPEHPETTDLPRSTERFFGETVPGVFKGLDIHFGRTPTASSLERYDFIPPGGGRFDLPDHLLSRCWREKPAGTTDVMGRMRWDAPSLTIRTEFFKPEKGQYLHPQWDPQDRSRRVNRVITHFEAALLQDFPRDYLWCGSKVGIARQIGNAVPVGFAAAIARHLHRYL
jgi:DNA (cytosine-5)-methyltransferase 1